MPEENETMAKVSIIDRPLLVVSFVTTVVMGSLFVLAYFGILHY